MRIEAPGGKTKISQMVEVEGPVGPILQGMLGPQVSKEFGTLLANLARKAEATWFRAHVFTEPHI